MWKVDYGVGENIAKGKVHFENLFHYMVMTLLIDFYLLNILLD